MRVTVNGEEREINSARVDALQPFERRFAHGRDRAATDAEVTHRVQAGFGVEHAPASDHQVEWLRRGRCARRAQGRRQERLPDHAHEPAQYSF